VGALAYAAEASNGKASAIIVSPNISIQHEAWKVNTFTKAAHRSKPSQSNMQKDSAKVKVTNPHLSQIVHLDSLPSTQNISKYSTIPQPLGMETQPLNIFSAVETNGWCFARQKL